MKLIFVVLLIGIAACSARVLRTEDDMVRFRQDCSIENDIPTEEVENIKKGKITPNDKTKCYIRCVAKKMEIFEDDKGINVSLN